MFGQGVDFNHGELVNVILSVAGPRDSEASRSRSIPRLSAYCRVQAFSSGDSATLAAGTGRAGMRSFGKLRISARGLDAAQTPQLRLRFGCANAQQKTPISATVEAEAKRST
jgi:hypothetical protein